MERNWLLNLIKVRFRSRGVEPITAMDARDVLSKMVDYVDEQVADIVVNPLIRFEGELIIKAPGNELTIPEEGDWKWKIDPTTKNHQLLKYKGQQWVLTEENGF